MKLSVKVAGVSQYKEKKDIDLTDLSTSMTIGSLCDRLLEESKLDNYYESGAVNLMYLGRVLAYDKSLQALKIKNGGKLILTIKKDAKVKAASDNQ